MMEGGGGTCIQLYISSDLKETIPFVSFMIFTSLWCPTSVSTDLTDPLNNY